MIYVESKYDILCGMYYFPIGNNITHNPKKKQLSLLLFSFNVK